MNGSRNVEDVTFTYYTGHDGSVQCGPHCHSCMNRLYHDDKLNEVQFAYVPTPNGFIEFRLRTLVFLYGIQAPFTMTSFSEDIAPRKCTLCAGATGSQDISDALDKHQSELLQLVTRKRKLNSDSSSIQEESDRPRNIESVTMKNILPKDLIAIRRSQPPTITLSDSEDLDEPRSSNVKPEVSSNIVTQYPMISINAELTSDHSVFNLPFIRGRNVNEVLDPMTKQDVLEKVAALRDTAAAYLNHMTKSAYFGSIKQETHFHCDPCEFDVWASISLVQHILSDDHLEKVYAQGLVFSESDDYDKLVNIGQAVSAPGIDFPFFHPKHRSEVNEPLKMKQIKHFSRGLSDEVLASIVDSYFRDMKMIYCHHCKVIFNSPHGSELIRHYISSDHFQKVIRKNRCFSIANDLGRLRGIYSDASVRNLMKKHC